MFSLLSPTGGDLESAFGTQGIEPPSLFDSFSGLISTGVSGLGSALGSFLGPLGSIAGSGLGSFVAPLTQAFGIGPDGPDPRLQFQRQGNREVANQLLAQLGAFDRRSAQAILQDVLRSQGLVGKVPIGSDGRPVNFKKGDIEKLTRISKKGVLAVGGIEAFDRFTGRTVVVDALRAAVSGRTGGSLPIHSEPVEGSATTVIPSGPFQGLAQQVGARIMPTVATSPGAVFSDILGQIGQAAGQITPLVQAFTGGGGGGNRFQPAVFGGGVMPGGAMPATLGLPGAGALDTMARAIPGGAGACITPVTSTTTRYPKQVQFQTVTPNGTPTVETYVRAPKVRYRVTGTIRRRRCSGGR